MGHSGLQRYHLGTTSILIVPVLSGVSFLRHFQPRLLPPQAGTVCLGNCPQQGHQICRCRALNNQEFMGNEGPWTVPSEVNPKI